MLRAGLDIMWSETLTQVARASRQQREVFQLTEVGWEPPVDVFKTDTGLLVIVALPGVQPDDIETIVGNGELRVRGIRRWPTPQRPANVHRIELPNVDTGGWLTGRKVLLHPSAIGYAEHGTRKPTVALTKKQVVDSPDILQHRPVSLQMQNNLYDYYGWDPLWGARMYGGGLYGAGMAAVASPLATRTYFGEAPMREAERRQLGDDADPHLRSIAEVNGYHVHAADGNIGHVEDFLVESESWGIRYLVINTSNWWVGRHVLISPYAVKEVDWSGRHVRLDVDRAKVKASPSWNPSNEVDGIFERRLHSYYNWPGHGW